MAQKQQDLKMDDTKQLEGKINMDSLERQKLLVCQALEELQELWEERQRDKNEIKSLKKKIEQQQEDIDKLAVEKEEQCISIKQLRSQLWAQNKENTTKAIGEKHLIQKIHLTAHQEKAENTADCKNSEEPLVGGHQNTIEQLQRLMIKTQKVILETKQAREQMQKNMENLKQEIQGYKKYVTQQKSVTEQIKLNITKNLNKIKQRCTEIQMQKPVLPGFQSRKGREGKGSFDNLKIKLYALLEETNKLCLVPEKQGQLEMIKRDKQELKSEIIQMQKKEKENNLPSVQPENDEIKRAKDEIQREKEDIVRDRQVAAAEMEAVKCVKENIEKERVQLADQFEKTKKKIREMEVLSIEIDGKKRELTRMIRMSRRKKDEKCEICGTDNARQEMEVRQTSEGQESPHKSVEGNVGDRLDAKERFFDGAQTREQPETQVRQVNMETSTNSKDMSGMQRVALEVEELRKMLTRVRENTERSKSQTTTENNQIKWMNAPSKEDKSELTPQDGSRMHERPIKEQKAFETGRKNVQQQKKVVEENVQQAKRVIQQMTEIKAYIQKAAAEINNTKEEMIKAQRMMNEETVMVRKHMVSETFCFLSSKSL